MPSCEWWRARHLDRQWLSDNGSFTIGSVSVSPNNGGLGVLLNQSNSVVTILSALLIGTYTVTVPITDNCGATIPASFTVTVTGPTITVNPTSLPNATVNTYYPQVITASPAGGNYTFAVTNGALPPGMTMNSNGSFSGAPTQSGTFIAVSTCVLRERHHRNVETSREYLPT